MDVLVGLGLVCLGAAWLCFRASGDVRAERVHRAACEPRGGDPEARHMFDEW